MSKNKNKKGGGGPTHVGPIMSTQKQYYGLKRKPNFKPTSVIETQKNPNWLAAPTQYGSDKLKKVFTELMEGRIEFRLPVFNKNCAPGPAVYDVPELSVFKNPQAVSSTLQIASWEMQKTQNIYMNFNPAAADYYLWKSRYEAWKDIWDSMNSLMMTGDVYNEFSYLVYKLNKYIVFGKSLFDYKI